VTQSAAAQLRLRIIAFLQAVEIAVAHLQDRRQPVELETALTVDPIGTRHTFSRIARPCQTDSRSFMVAEAIAPSADLMFGRAKIGRLRRDRFEPRAECEWQAQQRAVQIEVRRRLAARYDLCSAGEAPH
jgi:hypothetical protein